MTQTIEAVYDGNVLRPDGELQLEPNTRVRLIVEELAPPRTAQKGFLETARSLNLQGPPDWASNLDNYLYGDDDRPKS